MRNRFIVATLRDMETNEEKMYTFDSYEEYFNETFSPWCEILFATDFKVKGDTYDERKNFVRDMAINYSNNQACGLSWHEVAMVSDMFYTLGKRYGLLKEFRENAIC